MRLHIMRHGETSWNVEWRMQGTTDIPLNEKGLAQAEEAAQRLKDVHFDAIYSSPLKRALVTAQTIAAGKGMEVFVDDRLKEMCFGTLEGTTPDYQETNPNRVYFFKAPEKYVPTENGESFDEVERRVLDFFEYIKSTGYEDVLVVTHGAYVRAMYRAIYHTPVSAFWEDGVLQNCETAIIEL